MKLAIIEQKRVGGFVIGREMKGRWGLNSPHLQVGLKIVSPYIHIAFLCL